ncbi:MAG: hypothetical protein Phog2KO_49190 [Phototrophicaceae bacterium]
MTTFRRGFIVAFITILTTALGISSISAQDTVDCPTDTFIDVQADPANSEYAAPELSVSCTDDMMIIESNGIPNYEFIPVTPGNLTVQDLNIEIPLEPTIAEETTDIALLGLVAVAVNGAPIFGPNEGGNLGFGDPMLDEILDFCNGHVGPSGYHLHASPTCLFDDYESANLVIGYALDGFPIFAPYVCADDSCSDVVEVTSSWERTSDVTSAWDAHEYIEGSGDLDQCNGMTLEDGSYAYFATQTFPYVIGCYVGELATTQEADAPSNDEGGQQGAPPNGDGEQQGAPPNDDGNRQGNRPPNGGGNGQGNPPPNGQDN